MKSHPLWLLVFLPIAGILGTLPLLGQDLPQPREPNLEPVTRVEQILPGIRKYVESAHPKAGEAVIVLTGHSVNPIANEAVPRALSEIEGVEYSIIQVPDFAGVTDEVVLQRDLWIGGVWYPKWILEVVKQADVVYQMTMLANNHNWVEGLPLYRWIESQGARMVRLGHPMGAIRYGYPYGAPEALSYEPLVSFPEELVHAIERKVREQLPSQGWAKAETTDLNGTDFTVEINYDPGERTFHSPGKRFRNANGVIVTTSSHDMEFPRTELALASGRLTEVKRGGAFGEWLKEKYLVRYRDTDFGYYGEPGNNFFEEFVIGYHPKAFPYKGDYTGSQLVTGIIPRILRSGSLHVAVGSGGALLNPDKSIKVKKQHTDFELYFPTIVIAGKTIVKHGHLSALDDPEVRRVAAKYGDPDELLSEAWIPKRKPDGTVDWEGQNITRRRR